MNKVISLIRKNILLWMGILCFSSTGVLAQNSSLLYYFENLPQSNYLNPAMMPRANSFVGLPGASGIALDFKSDIAPKDLIQKSGGIWVQPLDADFNYDEFYKSFGKSASINASVAYAPIYFGFRTKKGYFTFSLQQKINARFGLPKDLFRLAEKGFGNGETLDFKSMQTKLVSYHELSFGYAHQIDEKLTVGVHLKPLSGIAAAQMKFNELSISNNLTSYTLNVDGSVYSSIPFVEVTEDENGFPDEIDSDEDLESSDFVNQATPKFKNFGIALDLGAVYDLNNKVSFSAALNNLGYVNWKSNLNSSEASGTYRFEGPNISIQESDDIGESYEAIGDSIRDVMDANTGKVKFSTGLSPELMLGSVYHANHVLDLGFLSRSTFAKYNFRQEFVLSANFNLYKAFSTTLAYNHEIKGSKDLGLGFALRGGPFQFYLMLNHIPFYYDKIESDDSKFIAPTKAETFSVMTGINFVFGKHGYRNKPMIGR